MDARDWDWVSQVHKILSTTNDWVSTLLLGVLLIYIISINISMFYTRYLLEQKQQKILGIQGVFFSISRTLYLFGISITIQLLIAIFFFIIPSFFGERANLIRWAEIYWSL